MIRIGNLSKIGFSRITQIPAAATQLHSNRKFCEKIPDKNSINSIFDEIKKSINKLESEIGRSIVTKNDDKFGPKALKPPFKQIPRKTAEIAYKEPEKITLHFAKISYKVDEEPKQREIKIELTQNEHGFKNTKISQNIENGEDYGFCHNYFLLFHWPEDVRRLSSAVQTLEFEWPENYAKALRQDKPSMLCQQLVKVNTGSYKLAMHLLPNKQLDFQMESILACTNHKLWNLRGPIPIEVFYWLKAQMDEIAAYYDCEDEFDQEEDDEDNEDEIGSDDDE